MITKEVLNNAFVLYLSGAAEFRKKNEMWWQMDDDYDKITIEFVSDSPSPSHVIIRRYYTNENLYTEAELVDGKFDGFFHKWDGSGRLIKSWTFKNNVVVEKKCDETDR